MKRMTTIAILIFAVTQISNAGWLSSIGQRIVNGAVNTVQTNISGKVNKTINDTMDGKLAPQQKNNGQSHVDEYSGHPGLPNTGASAGGPAIVETQESTYRGEKGKALPFTGRYEQIDLGTMKFTGERVFYDRLSVGTAKVTVDEFLNPGYYLIWIDSGSRTYPISVYYEHEVEGIGFGYGIVDRKKIFNNGPRDMLGNKEGIMYVVEVLPNTQGHVELHLVNSQQRLGTATMAIYKIPGPTLK
jgi:hypothetical protein